MNSACQEGCHGCTSNYCHMCQIGFFDVNGQCDKILCIENCDLCETSTACYKCKDQFYLLGNTKNECTSNFIAIHRLFKIKKGCEDTISNCVVCENQNVCKECKDGYFWDGTKCEGNFYFNF